MKEKLIIKNFGPIKNVELELGRFNVLIGDQGTGKSTVAKLLTAIESTFFRELFDVAEDETVNRETQLFFEYLKIVGLQNYLKEDSEIYYNTQVYSFQLKQNGVNIEKFREPSFEENLDYDINYIVAERSLVQTLANSLYALIEIKIDLPKLFLRFGNRFQRAIKEQKIFDYTTVLRVKYSYKDNKSIIILSSGMEIPFDDASSGVQGSVILLTVFDSITSNNKIKYSSLKNQNRLLNYLIIEEPELKCFPETQYKLLKYLVEKISFRDNDKVYYKNRLLITTHSPYILTSVNNLMYAYNVGKKYSEEADKIIEKKYWINPDDVSVYMMLPNGECEDIFDRGEGLIKAEKMDGVTNILNEQFSELLNLEFAANEFDN